MLVTAGGRSWRKTLPLNLLTCFFSLARKVEFQTNITQASTPASCFSLQFFRELTPLATDRLRAAQRPNCRACLPHGAFSSRKNAFPALLALHKQAERVVCCPCSMNLGANQAMWQCTEGCFAYISLKGNSVYVVV